VGRAAGAGALLRAVPGTLVGGLLGGFNAAWSAPGWVRVYQTWLIHVRERLEQLDNALAWVDPLATQLLLRELFIAAAAASTALAALAVLPVRQLTRAYLAAHLLPAPAHTLLLLLSLQRVAGLEESFASGLLCMPEAVGAARGDLRLLDRALLALRTAAARRMARRAAAAARGPPQAAAAPAPAAAAPAAPSAWMRILERVPTAERAAHMQLNSRALAALPATVRTRLVVTYNPVLLFGASCALRLELWAEDEDVLDHGGSGGGGGSGAGVGSPQQQQQQQAAPAAAGGQLELEFILRLPEGAAPVLLLTPLPALRDTAPELHAALCGCAPATELRALPSRQEAYHAPTSLFYTAVEVRPRWERLGAAAAATARMDGVRTSLWLKLQCAGEPLDCAVSLGCVPLQLAARPLPQPPPWLLPPPRANNERERDAAVQYDVVLSYRADEAGERGDRFAERLHAELCTRAAPGGKPGALVRSFTYASQVAEGRFELSTVFHGVRRCRLFVPICSPTYAHARLSPGTANELYAAARAALPPGNGGGAPAILPVWHSGVFPPPGAAHVLQHTPRVRLPGRATGQPATPPASPGGGMDAAAAAAAAAREGGGGGGGGLTVLHLSDPVGATADAIVEALELLRRGKDLKSRFGYE
jgi:hypothetical protein